MSQHVVDVVRTVNASPGEVWAALTTPERFKQYFFGTDVETDWRPGSDIRFRGEWKGKAYIDKGEIQAAEPQKRLSFTHWSAMSGQEDRPENYHIVTFDLEPEGKGTRVTLSQDNPDGAEPISAETRREFEKNWTMVLDGLKDTVEKH